MSRILKLKIDLMKIDKSKLFKAKSGAVYLDATVFLKDEADQYENCGMITQEVSKADRDAGVKGAILGNAKDLPGKFTLAGPAAGFATPATYAPPATADDLPF